MFPGPSLPYGLKGGKMATSPDGGGVILFGGWKKIHSDNFLSSFDYMDDSILELRHDSNRWTTLPQKLTQARYKHLVIPLE